MSLPGEYMSHEMEIGTSKTMKVAEHTFLTCLKEKSEKDVKWPD
jgi:hypothetical protein